MKVRYRKLTGKFDNRRRIRNKVVLAVVVMSLVGFLVWAGLQLSLMGR